jgi:hypothetical protein
MEVCYICIAVSAKKYFFLMKLKILRILSLKPVRTKNTEPCKYITSRNFSLLPEFKVMKHLRCLYVIQILCPVLSENILILPNPCPAVFFLAEDVVLKFCGDKSFCVSFGESVVCSPG